MGTLRGGRSTLLAVGRHSSNPVYPHDVGAGGGLSNAIPELVSDGGRGELRDILSAVSGHEGPLEIWCNESGAR